MDNPIVKIETTGRVVVNGSPYPYYVEKGELDEKTCWYLQRPHFSHKAFAWHKRKSDVISAISVFIEGSAEPTRENPERDIVMLALQRCLEGGSRNVVKLCLS